MNILQKTFGKYRTNEPAKKDQVGTTLARLKGVNDMLADVVEATEKLDFVEALKEASPWAEAVGNALGDAIPPVRFVLKLFAELNEFKDPDELGYLAATLAYQQAVGQAWAAMPESVLERVKGADPELRKKGVAALRAAVPAEGFDFGKFSFENALQSDFIAKADEFLKMSADGLGLADADFLNLQHGVRTRFVSNLKGILSHGSTRERFAPFRDRMTLDTREARAYDALREHADYQRWLFEEQPVLGREPFTLAQVYTENHCGVLRWEEIHKGERNERGERVDPFQDLFGGRTPLIGAVLDLIAARDFHDAIVIQGVAGSGKSASTLRLAWELVRQGLRPIRIELKHLDSRESTAIEDALPEAVHLTSRERDPKAATPVYGKDLFLDEAIFKESVLFRGTEICPFVLILDGWDEISIGASGGYQQRVERMLEAVRRKFLGVRTFPIRVILAGRPTQAIEASKFLRNQTRMLTVRDLSPNQLESYVRKVGEATRNAQKLNVHSWSLIKVEVLPKVLSRYRQARANASDDLEILGLPLLAHLALRLLAERPDDAEQLLQNTTSLYRNLVDLVMGQAGKPAETEVEGSAMLKGLALRRLLRGTAEAMTTFGAESIPHDELVLRLGLEDSEFLRQIDELSGEKVLSRLMISFFFKGGRTELGAEFSHKSFREYLFAEQIVEALKDYGRQEPKTFDERPWGDSYWKEFEPGDPRRDFCHRLAELLGPVWLTSEVSSHVRRLLEWEILRSDEFPVIRNGEPTLSLSKKQWNRVRDGLADAWDWWGQSIPLRPQPVRRDGYWQYEHTERPLALQVVEKLRLRSNLKQRPVPRRTTAVDAHLGDGLFLVTAVVHAELALTAMSDGAIPWNDSRVKVARRFQVLLTTLHKEEVLLFAPCGPDRQHFSYYCSRICAGRDRPLGLFPSRAFVVGVYLGGGLDLRGVHLGGSDLRQVNLSDAYLAGVDLRGADLSNACLRGADLTRTSLVEANLSGGNLHQADLTRAELRRANLNGTFFRGAVLTGADLSQTDLRHANIAGAVLRPEDLEEALYDPEQIPLLTFERVSNPANLMRRRLEPTIKEPP